MTERLRRRQLDQPVWSEQDLTSLEAVVRREVLEGCSLLFASAPTDIQIAVEPRHKKSTNPSIRVLITLDLDTQGLVTFFAGGVSLGEVTTIPSKQDELKLLLMQDAILTRLKHKGWSSDPLIFGNYNPLRIHSISNDALDDKMAGKHVPVQLLFGLLITKSS